jgi:hypothetical protein
MCQIGNDEGSDLSIEEGWAIIEKRLKEYVQTGMAKINARKQAEEVGLIWFTHNGTDRMRSFTKTSGNELNAQVVICFVIECSKILAGVQLHLNDEGDALYCPVLIKDGLAKPDRKKIKNDISLWNEPDRYEAVHGKYEDVTKKEPFYNELLKRWFSFGDPNQFIRLVKAEAYLNKRKKFKTKNLTKDSMDNFETVGRSFLADEKAESASYYDDIDSFPRMRTNERKQKNGV